MLVEVYRSYCIFHIRNAGSRMDSRLLVCFVVASHCGQSLFQQDTNILGNNYGFPPTKRNWLDCCHSGAWPLARIANEVLFFLGLWTFLYHRFAFNLLER